MYPVTGTAHEYRDLLASYLQVLTPALTFACLQWRQMDLEFTFWQMFYICIAPKTVYKQTTYRKQTKNQWARADPAFVVITATLVAVAATAYCMAFGPGIASCALTILSAVFVDFVGLGMCVATLCWYGNQNGCKGSYVFLCSANSFNCYRYIANNYLRRDSGGHSHAVEQKVEWLYAFDVHCNSFFPLFIAL